MEFSGLYYSWNLHLTNLSYLKQNPIFSLKLALAAEIFIERTRMEEQATEEPTAEAEGTEETQA